MIIQKYERNNFFKHAAKRFKKCDSLLDIGCGIQPFLWIKCKVHVCLEPWQEYIDILSACHPKGNFVFVKANALDGIKFFPNNSIDCICMIDLIEHLPKDEGILLLRESERVAKQQIVVFTPLGFVENHSENGKDAWGLSIVLP